MTIEHELREVLEAQAARAPGPERVLAGLGPARRRDRGRRRLIGAIGTAVVVGGAATAYILTHPLDPAPLKGPVRTVTFDYGPSTLPRGYVEISRGVLASSSGSGQGTQIRTWGYGGWLRSGGGSSKKVTLTVSRRWDGPGRTGTDYWRQYGRNDSTSTTVNGHPAWQFKDVDHYCGISWLETPDLILQVGVESTSGDCGTAIEVAHAVTRVHGVTATLPLRVAPGTPGWADGFSEVLRDPKGCLATLTRLDTPEITIVLRNGPLAPHGTGFRLDGRRARYYPVLLDWSRPPYDRVGPAVMVDVGKGRSLIVVGPTADEGTKPQTPATIRTALARVAHGVTAGPLPTCSWG
jgi:hypothetical protein